MAARRYRIVVCRGPECGDRHGSAVLHAQLAAALEAHGVTERAELAWQSCFGRCTQGPNVLVRELVAAAPPPALGTGFATPPGPRGATALYNHVDRARVDRIVAEHVGNGRIARELIERPGETGGLRYSLPVATTPKDGDS